MFSDALDVARCIELKQAADEAGIGASFGVGTNLTNGALAFYLASLLPTQLTLIHRHRLPSRRRTRAAGRARRRSAAD